MKTLKLFIVKLFYKEKSTGTSGNLYVSSRSFFGGELYTSSPDIFGGLISINGLGLQMGEVLPEDRTGSITISGVRGNYQFDKRFYDLTEYNTFIEQDFIVYSFEKNPDIIGDSSDLKVEAQGKISNLQIDIQGHTTTFTVRTDILSLDNPHKFVDTTSYPNALPAALGRYPIIFGVTQTPAFCINTVSPSWGYASSFGADLFNVGVQNYYCRDHLSEFVEISSAISLGSKVFTGAGTTYGIGGDVSNGDKQIAEKFIPSTGSIGSHVSVELYNPTGGNQTYNLDFLVSICDDDETRPGYPGNEIASGKVTLVADLFTGGQKKSYNIALNKHVIFKAGKTYYITFGTANNGGGGFTIHITYDGAGTGVTFLQDTTVTDWQVKDLTSGLNWGIYGVFITEIKGDATNIDYFTLSQIAAPSGQTNPDLSELEFIVNVSGLYDSAATILSSGMTGSIVKGHDVIRALWFLMKGSLADLDTTTYSPGTYIGNVAGKTNPEQSYRDIFADILENKAARLIPLRNGKMALWAWGNTQQVKQVFFEGDCNLIDINIYGEEYIINNIKIKYDLREVPLTLAQISASRDNYAQTLILSDSASISLYGNKILNDDFVGLDYITASTEAARWGNYKLYRSKHEQVFASINVPFWKVNYKELELLDIIELNHIDNPSGFGSHSSNQGPPLTTDGATSGDDYSRGFLWRKAKSYKARILAKEPNFNISDGDATLNLLLLFLNDSSEISSYAEPLDPV